MAKGWLKAIAETPGLSSRITIVGLVDLNLAAAEALRTEFGLTDATLGTDLATVLAEVQSGKFAKAFRKECGKGKPWMNKMRKSESNTQLEKVGRELRKMMKWINSKEIRK